ncbi:MAG: DUF2541 family protein [Saprospiraceae bacterium]|nr:DUF2541 family protein [Saprospiraceae bacterium]
MMKLINFAPKLLMLCAMTLFTLSFTTENNAFKGPWELLGMRKVNYSLDRDEIIVTRAEGIFTALKVKVKKAPINMQKLVVTFGNGEVEELELRNNFAAGSESRVIDLPGNKRVIKKIVFWYDTKNIANRKGIVEVWGRH